MIQVAFLVLLCPLQVPFVMAASTLSSIPTVENFINTGPVPTAEHTVTTASGVEFTVDMIKKFEKRFENGFNIYTDQAYVQWLRIHHPDQGRA